MPDAGTMTARPDARFCVVVPAYNEASGFDAFHQRQAATMDAPGTWQVIYVNDGSVDETPQIMRRIHQRDRHVALINLSRDFGKEAAMTAGLDRASGDAVIVIDADPRDPPELIP
jgi:glycosyltransferase involved in cell wall biosynthesis